MHKIAIKKQVMNLIGIEELISEYEQHCKKMSFKKTVSNVKKNFARYEPLPEKNGQKSSNLKKPNNNQKEMQQLNKIYTNKSFEFKHSYYHHNTLNNEISKDKLLKEFTQKKITAKPNKNVFSLINFNKKPTIRQHQSHRKISIKNNKIFLSSQPSLINSQTLIKLPLKSFDVSKNEKQQMRNSSYLSLKDKSKNQCRNLKEPQVQINLDNSTLTGINKKIMQFQKKVLKKQNPIQFRKSVKPQHTEFENQQQQRVKSARISQTIENDQINFQKQKEFVSIDTNYYGFSFKNRIPVTKNEANKNQMRELNSTIDKSCQDQHTLKVSNTIAKKISNSTSKIQSTKKPYSTLNTEKKCRYQSTLLLKSKNPNSSLFMKPKLLLKDRYQLMKVIGRGMSGQVYQAKDILSDRFVVIKEINVNSIQYEFFRQISHQNIIKYYNNFVQNGKRYLVLQYFPMTLKDLLKDNKKNITLTDDDVRHIFRSVLNGLAYLHSLSIAHRDIKLDNIVISQNLKDIKFIDFGLCLDLSKLQNELSKQFCGTLSYLPPEIVQGQLHQPRKADIWSLGIVLYAISLGRLPFKGKNQSEILSKICKSKVIYPQGFDLDLKQLIDWMLEKNPSKRCTITQIMSHKWLH